MTQANEPLPPVTSLLSPQEASKKYGISEKTLRKKIKEGRLPGMVMVGNTARIDPVKFEAYLKAKTP